MPSLEIARMAIKPLVNCRDFILNAFLEQYNAKLHDLVFRYLLNLTGKEFYRDEKMYYAEIGNDVQRVMCAVMPEPQVLDIIEKFNLNIGLSWLPSTNLEKKLRGVKVIRNMVTRAELKPTKNFIFGLWQAQKTEDKDKENDLKPLDPK